MKDEVNYREKMGRCQSGKMGMEGSGAINRFWRLTLRQIE
jgi:hypothetical protein